MKPRGITIRRQTQTESPQTGSTAIMDDTTYTMDDIRVMMGGQVTLSRPIKAQVILRRGAASIRKRR